MTVAERARELFLTALDLPPAERTAFVLEQAPDAEVRERVSRLLRAHDESSALFGEDRIAIAPRIGPGTDIGAYTLVERLGEGGFGVVFLAEQREPIQRQVAIKILKPGMDTAQVVRRFAAERQTLALMDHPHIATVYDAGSTDDGLPFVALEYVPGDPITTFCDRRQLDVHERLVLFEKVCAAVQHAHQKGVIHRDLKPGNVLITEVDGEPIPKVIDFGVAKAMHGSAGERTLTGAHQLVGTLEYMAPEQLDQNAGAPDTRADVYSLGVILYRLLCGAPPHDPRVYEDGGIAAWARTVSEQEPLRPSLRVREDTPATRTVALARGCDPDRLWRALRHDLDWITLRALEIEPSRRYQTANALAADLHAHLEHEPVSAGPPGALYRTLKFCRRNRVVVSASVTVFALAIVAAVISARAAVQAHRLRGEAEVAQSTAESATYRASIYAAAAALARFDVLETTYHLQNAPEELRGWEWSHLWARRDQSAITFRERHRASAVAFAPDSSHFAVGFDGGELHVYTTSSPTPVASPAGSDEPLRCLAFTLDGERVLSGGDEGSLSTWSWRTGDQRSLRLHGDRITRLLVHPDGEHVLTASWDGKVSVWRLPDLTPVRELQHPSGVNWIALSAEGDLVGTACWDQRVRIWELATGVERFAKPACRPETRIKSPTRWTIARIEQLVFTPTGLATGCRDGLLCTFDVETGQRIWSDGTHRSLIRGIDASPDGSVVVAASRDNTASMWRADDGRNMRLLRLHTDDVRSVAYDPRGGRFVTCGWDQSILLWNSDGRPLVPLTGHEGGVYGATFSPDGRWLLSTAEDHAAKLWDLDSIASAGLALVPGNCFAVTFGPNNELFAADTVGNIGRFDRERGARRLPRLPGNSGTYSLDVSPDGRWLAIASSRSGLLLHDLEAEADYRQLQTTDRIGRCVAWSPDGSLLASSWRQGPILLHDPEDPTPQTELVGHKGAVEAIAFVPEGDRLVSVGTDRVVRVWNVRDASCIGEFAVEGSGSLLSLTLRPDGEVAAVGSTDRTIRLIDLKTGTELCTLVGHARDVTCLAWCPDSSRIASGSEDATVRLWNPATGEPVVTLRGHTRQVRALAISPDGQRLVSAGEDAVIRTWSR